MTSSTRSQGFTARHPLLVPALSALLVLLAAFSFHDYHTYTSEAAAHPELLPDLLAGRGLAPQQYRIAIPALANQLHHLTHLPFDLLFGLIDFACGLGAAVAILRSLAATSSFQQASLPSQLARIATLCGLLLFYLSWCLRYQRPDTLPCALFVCLSALLLTSSSSRVALPTLVGLSVLQGFVRSDVAITFNAGLFLYALAGGPLPGTLRRIPTLVASALGALLSLAILVWLARVVYPHATYGATAVVQLRNNLSGQLFPFLLFLLPLLVGVALSLRRVSPDPTRYLLLSAALFLVSWFVLGRAQEVRIFFPFAMALIPLTANAFADRLLDRHHSA